MKILILSYSYAPKLNPRAFRWTAIARHWVDQGHQVALVCGSVPDRPDEETMDGVRVHRSPWLGLSRLRDLIKARQNRDDASTGNNRIPLAGLRAWLFRQLLRSWEFISWPDYACLWYWQAKNRALQLVANSSYDLLISVSLPFTAHLVGLAVKNRHPGLPWMVDIGDPFCFRDGEAVYHAMLFRWLNLKVEREVFALANVVSVTTPGTARRYGELFPEHASKINVILPLLSAVAPARTKRAMEANTTNRIRLVYVGTLYRSLRSPDCLLRLFAKLLAHDPDAPLELHFYGDASSCASSFSPHRQLMGANIFLHGLVEQQRAMAAMQQASILVNIGNMTTYQLPSKVVEYLAMNKPIINMVFSADDSSAAFFDSFGGVINIVGDQACLDSELFAKLLAFVRARPLDNAEARTRRMQEFSVQRIGQAYLSLLAPRVGATQGHASI